MKGPTEATSRTHDMLPSNPPDTSNEHTALSISYSDTYSQHPEAYPDHHNGVSDGESHRFSSKKNNTSTVINSIPNPDADHADRYLVNRVDLPPVNPSAGKFPYCLVWTPLPVIAWLVPFIGHLGICREDGTILDFAGSYFVCVDNFAFGAASRYLQLDPAKACLPSNLSGHICSTPFLHADYGTSQSWDQALAATVRTYQHAFYNIFTSNCHSFVACCLNRMAYNGSANWNVVELAALLFVRGKWSRSLSFSRVARRAVVRSQATAEEAPIAFQIGETSLSIPFSVERAKALDAAISTLLQTFREKEKATRPQRWTTMEYRHAGDVSNGDVFIEVFCNPNAYANAFQAKALITVKDDRMKFTSEARWCFSQYGLRPDRSTIGRILKTAERWDVTSDGANPVRRRAGAWPELEQAMGRWIANAGPAGVPLTLQTIRDHVAAMARNMGIPPTFRCSIGWVRRALRRQGVRCRAAQGEAASADMAAVRDAREKMPRLLTQLGVAPRDTFNLDETALWLSVLPRRTYSSGRIPGRKVSKERLTVAFLVNADGSHAFRPLVISKAKRPHDFRPDYDPEALCYWRHNAKGWMTSPLFTHFITHLNAAMFAEGRKIVVLLDNASSHMLRAVDAWSEIVCGVRTTCMSHVRLVFLPPNTTAFTQPLDQGIIATAKARYRQHWLRAFSGLWNADGATSAVARFRPNLRDVLEWLSESWTSVGARTIQRCWWRTGCLPLSWSLELPHVHDDEPIPAAYPDIELDDDIDDVGTLINTLDLGNAAMTAAEYVAIDDAEPTCAEGTAHPPVTEEEMRSEVELWQAPTTMQAVYDDADPVCREARRTARAACEMLIGYARATRITPRDLCALFDIRNPIIIARMERASPGFNLNVAPQPVPSPGATPTPETPRPRGRVLPDWMTRQSRRQQLLDAGVGAVMDGYVDAAEWMRL
ncbi:unnamed protein product [Closterium sp. NIES-64]|nr:unnamed protein product [Closterium sp. NIES-64]